MKKMETLKNQILELTQGFKAQLTAATKYLATILGEQKLILQEFMDKTLERLRKIIFKKQSIHRLMPVLRGIHDYVKENILTNLQEIIKTLKQNLSLIYSASRKKKEKSKERLSNVK
ncbi:MAG: hypothetical protein M0C28_39740 [Candidatus Moduliflexus flocculans]|nr:hypothetical protein [Candidatus Moduliflexus flocculans]